MFQNPFAALLAAVQVCDARGVQKNYQQPVTKMFQNLFELYILGDRIFIFTSSLTGSLKCSLP